MLEEVGFKLLSPSTATVAELLYPYAELYGLELVKLSGGRLKRGSIYVILARMADKGYVESRTVPAPRGTQGPARRKFKLTSGGGAMFEAHSAARLSFLARLGRATA